MRIPVCLQMIADMLHVRKLERTKLSDVRCIAPTELRHDEQIDILKPHWIGRADDYMRVE